MASRAEIRAFIDGLRPTLERAQAEGILARIKLDVRDQFEASIAEEAEDQRRKSLETFNEELEAFCTDLRLAVVTVQQQVERHRRRWGRGLLFGLAAGFGVFVLGLMMAGAAGDNTSAAGFAGVIAFIGGPIALIVGIVMGSAPEPMTNPSRFRRT